MAVPRMSKVKCKVAQVYAKAGYRQTKNITTSPFSTNSTKTDIMGPYTLKPFTTLLSATKLLSTQKMYQEQCQIFINQDEKLHVCGGRLMMRH